MSYRIIKSCIHPIRDTLFKQRLTETPLAFPISSGVQCELCVEHCLMGAIEQNNNGNFVILKKDCDECGGYFKVCPVGAIIKEG